MQEYESNELTQIIRNMDSEEQMEILKVIPSDFLFQELQRRERIMSHMLNGISELMNGEG